MISWRHAVPTLFSAVQLFNLDQYEFKYKQLKGWISLHKKEAYILHSSKLDAHCTLKRNRSNTGIQVI
jgi:hypothetical protein